MNKTNILKGKSRSLITGLFLILLAHFPGYAEEELLALESGFVLYDPVVIRGNPVVLHYVGNSTSLTETDLRLILRPQPGNTKHEIKGVERRLETIALWTFRFAIPALSSWETIGLDLVLTSQSSESHPMVPGREIKVIERNYESETIRLNPQMTELRTSPDPRKEEESRSLGRLLASFAPSHEPLAAVAYKHSALDKIVRTSAFGDRRVFLYANGTTDASMHNGTDFRGNQVEVRAGFSGIVVFAGPRIVTGNTVVIALAPGVYSLYYHLDQIIAKEGLRLNADTVIGKAGATGLVTGPHLHWELRIGSVPADPEALFEFPVIDRHSLAKVLSLPLYP